MPKGRIYGKPIDEYKGNCLEGKAFQVMIDNNLDRDVALYPYELVTYGETGQVCQNWMQYRLIKHYLEELTDDKTLVMASGHPMGLFASHKTSPRVIITNGLMVGMFDDPDDWARAAAMGVSNYGQMTAGGWMYIGPQGIVHGTFNTILNAGRKVLGVPEDGDLRGKLFVTLRPRRHERRAAQGGRDRRRGRPSSRRWISPASRPAAARAGSNR